MNRIAVRAACESTAALWRILEAALDDESNTSHEHEALESAQVEVEQIENDLEQLLAPEIAQHRAAESTEIPVVAWRETSQGARDTVLTILTAAAEEIDSPGDAAAFLAAVTVLRSSLAKKPRSEVKA